MDNYLKWHDYSDTYSKNTNLHFDLKFLFTAQMKYAIDGEQRRAQLYEQFFKWCLRTHSPVLLVLLVLFA